MEYNRRSETQNLTNYLDINFNPDLPSVYFYQHLNILRNKPPTKDNIRNTVCIQCKIKASAIYKQSLNSKNHCFLVFFASQHRPPTRNTRSLQQCQDRLGKCVFYPLFAYNFLIFISYTLRYNTWEEDFRKVLQDGSLG